MSVRRLVAALGPALLFAVVLLASVSVREASPTFLTQAIVWLPSGVGVAGLAWLGPSAWWVVLLVTFVQRLVLGYQVEVAIPAAVGSTAEALLGVLLLRRLGVRAAFDRLSDVLGLFVAAGLAPLVSIAVSWVARNVVWVDPAMPFSSGWDGWWRMNALGILTVVPAAGTFRARPRPEPRWDRNLLQAAEVGVPTLAILWVVMTQLPPGPMGVLYLYLTLFVALWGSLRYGPRGAITSAALTALVVALGTAWGHGPFLWVALEDRHRALQVFALSLLAVPLVVGALVAERQAGAALLEWQARVLEHIAAGRPPREVAEELARGIEARCEGAICSVLVVEDQRLRLAAAPSLPQALSGALEGLAVGPNSGACGTAAYRNERVIVRDVALDPLFVDFRDLALAHGLRACWSLPIRAPQGPVVGTFAVYHRVPWTPPAAEVKLVERAAVLAGLAFDRRALEEQLRQAQKMEALGKLAGGVAHDFNNLLTVIGGYAQAVREALPPGGEAARDLDEVLAASGRAAGLTSQLLAYSRQQVLTPQVLELGATLGALGGMLRRLIGEDVSLTIVPGPQAGLVRVDRGQLEQVVVNLAVNARDAMPHGGTLTLAAEAVEVGEGLVRRHPELKPGPYLALSVRDTGLGMASHVRARAFDPFFTTKEKGRGTGLGLSMVYGIVSQSGGAVWLDSRPGAGTTVWVYLPRVDALAREEVVAPPRPGPRGAGTVLVVEDEPVVRGLVVRTLRRSGFQVLEAADGQEALAVSRGHPGPIAAVVSDVVMPRMGGRDLVRRLLVERPSVRVLLMSGYPDGAWDAAELGETRSAFLQKPFSGDELVARLLALLADARPGSATGA